MQEFLELKLGNMTMKEYEKNFLELLRYVDFIRDEKVKIQHFINAGLLAYYKGKISYDEPKTLEEAIRKTHCLYEQIKGRGDMHKSWKAR